MYNFREIAEEIVKNENFTIPHDKYTKAERFKIREEVYNVLRFNNIKDFALDVLKDRYLELINSYSEEDINKFAESIAEEWVYNNGVNFDLPLMDIDCDYICKLIDNNYSNYSNYLEPDIQEK